MSDKFQAKFEPIRLYDENNPPAPVCKVGVLPFIRRPNGELQMLVMKPVPNAKEELGDPGFQLPKGTRHVDEGKGAYRNMREADIPNEAKLSCEHIQTTALREGHEEVGLKESNIIDLFDMSTFSFTSASSGKTKTVHMFAALVKDQNDFDHFEASTAETRWVNQAQFAKIGRPDHARILDAIAERLEALNLGGQRGRRDYKSGGNPPIAR